MYITVLNLMNKTVDVITVNKDELTPQEVEDILKFRGYDPKRDQYMVTNEISLRVL